MQNLNPQISEESEKQIEINELLQVCIKDDGNAPTYYSRVNDIAEGKLIIAWPTHAGMRLIPHRDQILAFSFVRDGVPHQFTGMIDGMSSEGIPSLTIIISSAIECIQRRQNYRVKCMLPVEVIGVLRDPKTGEETPLYIRTTTTDLSAGGLSLRHSKLIPEGSLVEIKLTLPDDAAVIKIPCRVVHLDCPGENQMMYRAGIRFLAISESERARIVRFAYRTQLKGLHP